MVLRKGPDFINMLKIVEVETNESVYFPVLLCEFNPSLKKITERINQGIEIHKIIVASVNMARLRINSK